VSCFCIAHLDLLPDLDANASLNLATSAQAAMALYGRISLGIPNLAGPPFKLPRLTLPPLSAMASLSAMAQLRAQAMARLGIDLATPRGITALARLTATLDARMPAIANLNLNLNAWVQLASVNAVAVNLSAICDACLSESASSASALKMAAPPLSWGGPRLSLLTALLNLSAQLNVSLDASFVASLQAMAQAIASIGVTLNVSAAATLSAGFCAIAQLKASLRVDPLQIGLPAVRAQVAANFSAMTSLAAQLGIDLSLGIPGLPALPDVPGFAAALTASLTAQLRAVLDASISLPTPELPSLNASMSALLSASLSLCLSSVLGIDVALPAPCAGCDLRAIMARPKSSTPASHGSAAAAGSPPSGPAGTAENAPSPADPASDSALDSAAGSGGGGGGGSGGGGGGGGGGGVQATIMTAQLLCTMGMAPSALSVLPINRTQISKQFAANIMDHVPMANIMPFGMCMSPANPTVAAATAAAMGVLTPMPCIPATSAPWVPGAPTVMLGGQPMLDSTSKCMCNWAGMISIVFPGQVQTAIP
jgi:hypothetical protein